jgi:potassium/hydrogen antiporter
VSVGPALTIRPWEPDEGDPANPERVFGVPVQEILARRDDRTAALVALRGNRFALTGPVTAMGRSMALHHYIRVRARDTRRTADRLWLDEVNRLLGRRQPRSAPLSRSAAARAVRP